jgi:hypothetical protein
MSISQDGKLAVVWTTPINRGYAPTGEDADRDASRVALLDLEQMTVLAEEPLLYSITTAAVDQLGVYVAPSKSDRVDSLNRKDLSLSKRVNVDSAVTGFVTTQANQLIVVTARSTNVLSLPDMGRIDLPALREARSYDEERLRTGQPALYGSDKYAQIGSGVPISAVGDLYLDGCVFNKDLSKLKMITNIGGVLPLSSPRQGQPQMPATMSLWNRRIANGSLTSSTGQRICELKANVFCIMRDYPAVVLLSAPGQARAARSISLDVLDMITGKSVMSLRLKDVGEQDQAMRAGPYPDPSGGRVLCAGRRIVSMVAGQVYAATLSDEAVKELAYPLEFEPLEDVPQVASKDTLTITHKLRGGDKPFEFDLKSTRNGIEIDKSTGTVTVKGPSLMDGVCQSLVEQAQHQPGPIQSSQANARQLAQDMSATRKDCYKRLLGHDASAIPVLIPITVVASDKNQQFAQMDYQLVVMVGEDALTKAFEEFLGKARLEQANHPRPDESTPAGAASKPSDAARIERLERRVADLEAKIDLLVKMMQQGKN